MKHNRLFGLLAVLLLLTGLLGYIVCACSIAASAEDVSFTQETVLGNPALTDGLEVQLHSSDQRQLFWDSTLPLSDLTKAQTQYRNLPDGENLPPPASEPFSIKTYLACDSWSPGGPVFGLDFAMEELHEKLDGQTNLEVSDTVLLRDYLDTYVYDIQCLDAAYAPWFRPGENDTQVLAYNQMLEDFRAYFAIPVLDKEYVALSLKINDQNTSFLDCSQDFQGTWADRYDMDSHSVQIGSQIYFTISGKSSLGIVMDFGSLPEGYGLFSLTAPVGKELPSADQLDMVYALNPDQDILALEKSADARQLFLLTMEKGQYKLLVLDCAAMTPVSILPLGTCEGDPHGELRQQGRGMVVSLSSPDCLAALSQANDGSWQLDFTCDSQTLFPDGGIFNLEISPAVYDGSRLAAAIMTSTYYAPSVHNSNAFYLTVVTKDGIQYQGIYRSSLTPDGQPSMPVYGTEVPLELSWK